METKEVFINKNLLTAKKVILDNESSLPDAEAVALARKLLTFLYKEKVNNRMIELAKELAELLDLKLEIMDD